MKRLIEIRTYRPKRGKSAVFHDAFVDRGIPGFPTDGFRADLMAIHSWLLKLRFARLIPARMLESIGFWRSIVCDLDEVKKRIQPRIVTMFTSFQNDLPPNHAMQRSTRVVTPLIFNARGSERPRSASGAPTARRR